MKKIVEVVLTILISLVIEVTIAQASTFSSTVYAEIKGVKGTVEHQVRQGLCKIKEQQSIKLSYGNYIVDILRNSDTISTFCIKFSRNEFGVFFLYSGGKKESMYQITRVADGFEVRAATYAYTRVSVKKVGDLIKIKVHK
ncbi:MAG: hypothetical protein ABIE43_01200 [Patescibacteria group bacterium]